MENRSIISPTALLPDELNIIYVQFDVDNMAAAICPHVGMDVTSLTLKTLDVR